MTRGVLSQAKCRGMVANGLKARLWERTRLTSSPRRTTVTRIIGTSSWWSDCPKVAGYLAQPINDTTRSRRSGQRSQTFDAENVEIPKRTDLHPETP